MQEIIHKYIHKLEGADLTEPGQALLGFLDADLVWNRQDSNTELFAKIFARININSLVFAPPKEPYKSIINYLTRTEGNTISPQDCETRTFIHDIPVVSHLEENLLLDVLNKRKAVIVKEKGILTYGWVSPEQTYINYSSVCFACFVKFFSDYLREYKKGRNDPAQRKIIAYALACLDPLPNIEDVRLKQGPFRDKGKVVRAMDEAGKIVVKYKLVDSFFGNISYLLDNCLYISQTSSSLDELTDHIDPCPLDNSSSAALTASSELSAHRDILQKTGHLAVLHGHPKFAVIMSMYCDKKENCPTADECHRRCPEKRAVQGFPIVPGEVGSGPFGLCKTVPPAIKKDKGVIVYGHGVFTTGAKDFNQALKGLLDIEKKCLQEYTSRIELTAG